MKKVETDKETEVKKEKKKSGRRRLPEIWLKKRNESLMNNRIEKQKKRKLYKKVEEKETEK
jgi:hypothetical protein